MSVVYLRGQDWDDLRKKLVEAGISLYKAQDRAVSSVAAMARPKIHKLEEQYFDFGKEQTKYVKTKRFTGYRTSRTLWSERMHGYVSGVNPDIRLIQYNWENKASRQARTGVLKKGVISHAYVFSRTANLWEHSTKPYAMRSALFGPEGNRKSWRQGVSRPGKGYFDRAEAITAQTVPAAIKRTEREMSLWEAFR